MSSSASGSYAPINGLDLYYELHGTGRPLVLLHGGLQTIALCFGSLIPTLEQRHQVIAVELQGHGHTADIDRDFSLDALVDDVAGLLSWASAWVVRWRCSSRCATPTGWTDWSWPRSIADPVTTR